MAQRATPSLTAELLGEPGSAEFQACFNCGTCTAACPVSWVDESYNPRRIIKMVAYNMRDEVLSHPAIWLCSACDVCYRRCPQKVRISDLMKAIRNVAVREGYEPSRSTAQLNERLCSNCGLCARACPYHAIQMTPTWTKGRQQTIVPVVDRLLCHGCGICTSACHLSAISVTDVADDLVLAQIEGFAHDVATQPGAGWRPRIVVFLCNWCLYSRLDQADVAQVQEQSDVQIVRVPCMGRMDSLHVSTALQQGVDGILVAGCRLGDCHYRQGNFLARNRMAVAQTVLAAAGESKRMKFAHVSTEERGAFLRLVQGFKEEIGALGAIKPLDWAWAAPAGRDRDQVATTSDVWQALIGGREVSIEPSLVFEEDELAEVLPIPAAQMKG